MKKEISETQKRSPSVFGTLFILFLLILSGCGKKVPTSSSSVSKNEGSSPFVTYPSTDYFEQQKGIPGGTLKISVHNDTGNIDPHAISHGNMSWMGRMIFDNVVYLDDKGNITPWLAKSWKISPDGKTYTFHLRDDVTFSDGAKWNAEAFRVNLEHMRAPETKSPLAAAYIAPYDKGKVIDEFTFQATLKEPYEPFLNVLAQSWLAMLSPKVILENPKQLRDAPVGSGPYIVESYVRKQGIRLVKRPDYHWSPEFLRHEGPAYLDRIEIDFIPEPLIRFTTLSSGQYQFTTDAYPQNAALIRADPNLVFDSRIRQGSPFRGLAFNTSQEPFNDVIVRRGVAAAIDREGIVQLIGFGEYKPKTDFLAANTRYYDPSYKDILKYDIAEANRLLDTAGWTDRDSEGYRTKNGKRLGGEMLVSEGGNPTSGFVAVAIQSDAKKVGVEFKLNYVPQEQLMEHRRANRYQAMSSGVWHTNTPDGLYIVYHSNEIISDKRIGHNLSRLQDPQLDDILARARRSSDPALLQDLYSQAQKLLIDLVPAVPLYDNYTNIGYQRQVKGVVFDTSHNVPFFSLAWLEKEGS